ncbi:MAG: STAS domain-containing protein [Sulfitobacter sp.]|nr:STAS domain-containing protein [Sulfitobacter sp.]
MAEVLRYTGRMDLGAVCALHADLTGKGETDIEVDLSEVTTMGALCLQCLCAAAIRLRAAGHQLDLIGSPPEVAAQIALMDMDPTQQAGEPR